MVLETGSQICISGSDPDELKSIGRTLDAEVTVDALKLSFKGKPKVYFRSFLFKFCNFRCQSV